MVAACPAVRLYAVGPTLKVPRMGRVHPIKPRQHPVVFPLRRKRTAAGQPALPAITASGRYPSAGWETTARWDRPAGAPPRDRSGDKRGQKKGKLSAESGKLARRNNGPAGRGTESVRRRAGARPSVRAPGGPAGRPVPRPGSADVASWWVTRRGRPSGRPSAPSGGTAFSVRPRTRKRSTRECGHAR